MRERVFGIETEYAVIYHPGRGELGRPNNLHLFGLFEPRLERRVASLPRAASLLRAKRGRFLENGSTFHYEGTPDHFEHGLIEMASPECRDPFTLLAHERAKDELMRELAAEVTDSLHARGWSGEVRIGKNNVDSQGHTFGSHESYWVEDPLPPRRKLLMLPLWAGLWVLSLPAFLWLAVVFVGSLIAALGTIMLPAVGALLGAFAPLAEKWRPWAATRLRRGAAFLRRAPTRVFHWVERNPGELARRPAFVEKPLHPMIAAHSALHRRFHFRAIERGLTAFLVTRTLYTGAGAVVLGDGPVFRMAQRPPFLRRLARIFTSGDDRPLYESRDPFFRPWSVFSKRRRLHLMLGDANLCEWAQVLRTGTTSLVLEAIEAEPDGDWPVLVEPLSALRAVSADVALDGELELEGRAPARAVALQREYLDRVRSVLARRPEPPEGWKVKVLRMWDETLALLESDPGALADRVDWIAKRALLRREVREPADWEALAARGRALVAERPPADDEGQRLRDLAWRAWRTDLRYHELGPRGGYQKLVRRGRVRELVPAPQVEAARREAPTDTRAHARGRAIRDAARRGKSGGATWHRVRIAPFDWRFFPDPLSSGKAGG
ncbi:MAG: proteasome accessory factor PafA2 family protein [Myxococcota bacterium]